MTSAQTNVTVAFATDNAQDEQVSMVKRIVCVVTSLLVMATLIALAALYVLSVVEKYIRYTGALYLSVPAMMAIVFLVAIGMSVISVRSTWHDLQVASRAGMRRKIGDRHRR